MRSIGELIPLPAHLPARIPTVARAVSLYPDHQQVWRPRLYRMPPTFDDESITYDSAARTLRENCIGEQIDLYA